MATRANEESSSFPSERYCKDRYSAYKKLLADLAQHLGPEDVKVIAFNCNLPENLKQSSALDVLDYLDKHAKFSPINIQPLAELLTDAYRNDLVNDYVEGFRMKYARHNSMPASGNQHLAFHRRVNTCPSNMKQAAEPLSHPGAYPPVQETGDFSPESNPFSPTEDTLHEDESACSQSSNGTLPSLVQSRIQQMETFTHPQPYSHPQPPKSMNYAQPKAMHQSSNQMQPGVMWSELQKSRGGNSRTRHHSESLPGAVVTTTAHFRQTSTPSHLHASSHHNYSGTSAPGSVSASSSTHEMNKYHNFALSEQEGFHCNSAPNTNESQDFFYEAHDKTTHHSYLEGGQQNNTREHSMWYNRTNSQASLPALEEIPQTLSTQANQYPADNSLSNPSKNLTSTPSSRGTREYGRVSTTPPPDFYRRTSLAAQLHVHKKTSTTASSTVSDSGVEMTYYKHPPSAGASADTIEPWMSASQGKEQFEKSLVISISTAVQTELEGGEDRLEKTDTLSPRTSVYEESANGGQHTGKQVAARKGRPRSAKRKLPFSRSKPQDDLKWHVKRNTLNKAIYDHKEQKCITCKKKLELDAECGGANPRLVFHLVPYGLEDDAGKSVTLEIEVEISRKTRMSMHSSTKIRLSVCVQEMKEGNLLAKHENIEQSIDVSRFFIPRFVTHECLKLSRCEQIEIQASAELTPHSEHPTDSK